MSEIKPIGTIISYRQSTYMIIGYEPLEIGNSIIPHYIVVPVPLGYTSSDSLRVIPIENTDEVIQEGFFDNFGKAYINGRSQQFDQLMLLPVNEWEKETLLFQESMLKVGGKSDD